MFTACTTSSTHMSEARQQLPMLASQAIDPKRLHPRQVLLHALSSAENTTVCMRQPSEATAERQLHSQTTQACVQRVSYCVQLSQSTRVLASFIKYTVSDLLSCRLTSQWQSTWQSVCQATNRGIARSNSKYSLTAFTQKDASTVSKVGWRQCTLRSRTEKRPIRTITSLSGNSELILRLHAQSRTTFLCLRVRGHILMF